MFGGVNQCPAKVRLSGTNRTLCLLLAKQTEGKSQLEGLKIRSQQLRAELAATRWPRLAGIHVSGRFYSLPLAADSEKRRQPDQSTLEYLAGFFDGDGNVLSEYSRSGCQLRVSQSYDFAEVLLLFQETFGGGIYREHDGVGLFKPSLKWVLAGKEASNVAGLMMSSSIAKQRQLEVAARWPAQDTHRQASDRQLRALKRQDSAVLGDCSWNYLAGFFDADGYIRVSTSGSLVLSISQKFPTILERICEFLASQEDVRTLPRRYGNFFHVQIGSTHASKRLLKGMLNAGLLRKAPQARFAITLLPHNVDIVRHALTEFTGNQMFGRKLDPAGIIRSREVSRIKSQARRLHAKGEVQAARTKSQEAEVLAYELELHKSLTEVEQLEKYLCWIRSLPATWEVGPPEEGSHSCATTTTSLLK